MKNLVFVLILVILAAGSVFAQEDTIKHWVSGELDIFGVGVRYEYMLSPKISIGANAYTSALIMSGANVFNVIGCFYPFEKAFLIELGLGYGSVKGSGTATLVSKETGAESEYGGVTTTGFVISPGLSWKIDVGKQGGFFLQPGFKLPIAIGKQVPLEGGLFAAMFGYNKDEYTVKDQSGTSASFIIHFNMGFAF
ncbi:MAG: hypothetical protein FWD22_05735 [Treponema sp.]|nr:hypothetical protein [Treponema sp.]